jgi:hypothetical protein
MKLKIFALIAIGSILVSSIAAAQVSSDSYDEPRYDVLLDQGPFQIRRYQSRIVAETTVRAKSLAAATSAGFGRLAEFIFGGNEGADGESQDIAMTTPVESAPTDGDAYTVVFTMPPEYDLEDLPKPNDSRVVIRRDEPRLMATANFRGVARDKDVTGLKQQLLLLVEQKGYIATSDVRMAQYDPPWIPGMFRRNELMVEIAPVE